MERIYRGVTGNECNMSQGKYPQIQNLHLDIQMKSEHSRIALIQTEFTLRSEMEQ